MGLDGRDYSWEKGLGGWWLREREVTGVEVWKCSNSAWWGGRMVSTLKGDLSLWGCTGLRNNSFTHLNWAPWPKKALRQTQCSQGERQDVYQALQLCRVALELAGLNCNTLPWLRFWETHWNSRKKSALPRWMQLSHWPEMGQPASTETESGTVCPDIEAREFPWWLCWGPSQD